MSITTSLDRVLRALGDDLRLTDAQLAGALGVSPRSLERWHAGERYPQHESRDRLDAMVALQHRLRETFATWNAAADWLHADSAYLGGLKPVEALHVGRIDAVDGALEALDSGIFL